MRSDTESATAGGSEKRLVWYCTCTNGWRRESAARLRRVEQGAASVVLYMYKRVAARKRGESAREPLATSIAVRDVAGSRRLYMYKHAIFRVYFEHV